MPDYKDYVKNRNFDAAGFKEHFGLESKSESEAYSKGSSTGTKQVGALGTYMSEDDYNRLKNDDKIWDLYAEVRGEEAADKKRKNGELSINTLDALLDDVSADAPKDDTPPPPTAPEEPVGQSEKLVTARTRAKQYEEDVLGGRKVFGDKSFEQNDGPSFLERYKLKLDEEYEQDPNDGLYVKRSDADRYRTQMDDYNKQKAEYDSKYGGQN